VAIWFHDAVYDTRRDDNEQKSAEWAKKVISQSGLAGSVAERVSDLILATRHRAEVSDMDAQLMVDVDLSILGADPEVFWQYEENIRKEYAWISESLFRAGRMEILHNFLNRKYIYHHQTYRGMFEDKARFNLKQAITKLSGRKHSV
jgi:predicted metal-dependent HD superfamily phosphohydrolase